MTTVGVTDEDNSEQSGDIIIYESVTTNSTLVKIKNAPIGEQLWYSLFDITGHLIRKEKFYLNRFEIFANEFNAGIYFIYNKFSAGISYRSGIKFKLDNGTVTYTDIPNGANILETIPAETSYKSDIYMPGAFDAGLCWKTTEKLSLTVNFSLSQWSSDDSVNYEFSEQPTLNYSEAVNYKNSAAVSFGGQYQYNERTLLRAGLAYEKTPVPDGYVRPSLPDANKWSFCGGISYTWQMGLTFDAAIMFQDYKTRIEGNNKQDNFNGQKKTNLYIIGLGLDYAF